MDVNFVSNKFNNKNYMQFCKGMYYIRQGITEFQLSGAKAWNKFPRELTQITDFR